MAENFPIFETKPIPKWESAGGIVCRDLSYEGISQILMILPANGWNRGVYTFPKGRVDAGERPVDAAAREISEETGRFVTFFPRPFIGKGEGSCSVTCYFLALDAGPTGLGFDKETEEVRWVEIGEAIRYLEANKADRDANIARKARRRIGRMRLMIKFANENGGV